MKKQLLTFESLKKVLEIMDSFEEIEVLLLEIAEKEFLINYQIDRMIKHYTKINEPQKAARLSIHRNAMITRILELDFEKEASD